MSRDRSFSTAIHIMTVLAYGEPNLISSQSISIGLRTNPALVRRSLLKLSENGLVISTKGKGGGNRLAKPADQINLKDIYLAVKEGPLFFPFDKEPYEGCEVSCNIGCILTDVYSDLEKSLLDKMRKVTVAKILSEIR